ncbi:NAD-dependent epimerase/dehydratase family protein [Sneathiella glossodoripedis]|uniref:NAD-dependent epimerase/dehydratase family protein n=1 Tax=Sneathiella glossodoripedis TaxID=418853 RepID=UPI00046EF9D5|nr:NAD(P)-dependent oxidoreductase [Sneathiella glossodoripedis]
MAKFIVTGATGNIGRATVEQLLKNGNSVIAISKTRKLEITSPKLTSLQLDLWNKTEVAEFLSQEKPEILIHLAWEATPGEFWHSSRNFDWVSASAHLLDAFVSAGGRRAILAGTCAEYQWANTSLSEDSSPLNPLTAYSASKLAFKGIADVISKEIELVWARIFFPYHAAEDPNRLLHYIATNVKASSLPTFNNPRRAVDLIQLDDVAKIFTELGEQNFCGTINICSGNALLPDQIGLIFAQILEQKELILEFKERLEKVSKLTSIQGDTTKLKSVINLKELTTIEQGISQYLKSFK